MGTALSTTHSSTNRRFLASDDQAPICRLFRGSNEGRAVSAIGGVEIAAILGARSLGYANPFLASAQDATLGIKPIGQASHIGGTTRQAHREDE